jgi:hypothetical protein
MSSHDKLPSVRCPTNLGNALVSLGLRQVLRGGIENIVAGVNGLFQHHPRTLPQIIQRALDRFWQSLAVALAGDGLLDRVKLFFASGDAKVIREQVEPFRSATAACFAYTTPEFRAPCLAALKRLRQTGLLKSTDLEAAEVVRLVEVSRRCGDDREFIEEAQRTVARIADTLAAEFPQLSCLLIAPTPSGVPLLGSGFAYFFTQEVEKDKELASNLSITELRRFLDLLAPVLKHPGP